MLIVHLVVMQRSPINGHSSLTSYKLDGFKTSTTFDTGTGQSNNFNVESTLTTFFMMGGLR